MHVEEGDPVSLPQNGSVKAVQRSPDPVKRSCGHVSGDDRVWDTGEPAVPEMNVRTAYFGSLGAQQRGAGWQVRSCELADLDRYTRRSHDGGEDAIVHGRTLPYIAGPIMRLLITVIIALGIAAPAAAQNYSAQKPRRQFVTVSIDWMHSEPLHFASHPLEDLVGREVAATQLEEFEYETRDGGIQIDVLEFKKRNRGFSAAVYPFGLSTGTTLGIRASVETVPTMRINFAGEEAPAPYSLTGAKAYEIGVGIYVADRAPGFGLGAQAFIVGGIGRIKADGERDGTRTFAEGGGGLMVGPFGVQLAAKFAWNRLDDPVEHRFLTIPITLRGTVSF